MRVPLNHLRDRLMDVHYAAYLVEDGLLRRYARPYEDGHLVMDFEEIEDRLRRLQAATSSALVETQRIVALAADEDGKYWDEAREMAA